MVDQMEKWKEIKDFPNYEVSNLGRIRNKRTKFIRKLNKSYGLYLMICLRNDNGFKLCYVHRLVGQAFIPNPHNKKEINHIDGNKHNNNVSNLEWCSRKENALHSIKNGLQTKEQFEKAIQSMKKANSRPILQIKDGKIIAEYQSVREVNRKLSYSVGHICECANGKLQTMYGYEWRYKNV